MIRGLGRFAAFPNIRPVRGQQPAASRRTSERLVIVSRPLLV